MAGAAVVLVLAVAGVVTPAPHPALKGLLESLSGDDSPGGEVHGDYQQVPYKTLRKLYGYEERRYPSVKWACTEAMYDVEDDDDEGEDSEEMSLVKMMQMMTNKKSWKKKPE